MQEKPLRHSTELVKSSEDQKRENLQSLKTCFEQQLSKLRQIGFDKFDANLILDR